MTDPLHQFIHQVQEEAPFILEDRRVELDTLSDLIHQQLEVKGSAELLFVWRQQVVYGHLCMCIFQLVFNLDAEISFELF